MSQRRFNEVELFLLEKWEDASRLEESMKAVRKTYSEIVAEVLDKVQSRYKELDLQTLHIADREDNDGLVCIGKKNWPLGWGNKGWPTGLGLQNIGLRNILSEEEDAPEAIVTIYTDRDGGVNAEKAQSKLKEAAEKAFGKKELQREAGTEGRKERSAYIRWHLNEPREALRKLLLEEPAEFVDHLVAHFDTLAGFIPVVDDIVSILGKRSE